MTLRIALLFDRIGREHDHVYPSAGVTVRDRRLAAIGLHLAETAGAQIARSAGARAE